MPTPAVFPVSTVINVQVTSPAPGLQGLNTGNLALFTDEAFNNTFPSSGIQYYQTSNAVGVDFGTSSKTYAMAQAIFSARPNILLPGGQLIVISLTVATQTLLLSGTPASGATEFTWGGNASISVAWNAITSVIQSAIQGIPGLSQATCTGTLEANNLAIKLNGVYGAAPSLFTLTTNTLETSGSSAITLTSATNTGGQSWATALAEWLPKTAFFGALIDEPVETIGSTDYNAAASWFQANGIIGYGVGSTDTYNQAGGLFVLSVAAGNNNMRNLYYKETANNDELLFAAGYSSLLQSVNFNGSKTALTMNGKTLNGVPVDDLLTPGSESTNANSAGSDYYVQVGTQGNSTPFVFSNGANLYADQVTGRLWIANALQTAYFNALKQTNTKIAQTEDDMNTVKNFLKAVMGQAVACAYAYGQGATWTSPDTFGNVTDFINNITAQGFYIYSQPVNQLTMTQILERQAPIVQIAYVEKNAIHSASVLVNVVA